MRDMQILSRGRLVSIWFVTRRDGKYLERAMGIEPTALAWEARVLPLYDARRAHYFTREQAVSANRAAARFHWRSERLQITK